MRKPIQSEYDQRLALGPTLIWVQWRHYSLAHAWIGPRFASLCCWAHWSEDSTIAVAAADPRHMPHPCPECLYRAGLAPYPQPPKIEPSPHWICRIGEHLGCEISHISAGQRCGCSCHSR